MWWLKGYFTMIWRKNFFIFLQHSSSGIFRENSSFFSETSNFKHFLETTINNLFFTQHPNWRIFRENNQFSFFSCKRCKPNFSNFQWKQCTYIQMVPMDKIKAWSVITQLVHVNHSCVSFFMCEMWNIDKFSFSIFMDFFLH